MKRLIFLLPFFIFAAAAFGQVLTGTIKNGTTDRPAAGDEVILLKLDKTMEEEARTKSNARGEFSFKLANAQVPHVIRVRHQQVNYHEPAFPGRTSVNMTVYDSSPVVEGVSRIDHSVVFQAQGNTTEIVELFTVKNASTPPRTQPTFEFYLPEGATVSQGQAMPVGGMPLKSAPVPQAEKNKYAFLYPVRPGETHFEIVYTLPYSGLLKFEPKLAGVEDKFYVVTPKSMTFAADSGTQFQSTDKWSVDATIKDVEVHVVDKAAPGVQLGFAVSGMGVLPDDNAPQQAQGGAARGSQGEDMRPGGGLGVPNEKPNPISSGQWAFLGVLTIFLGGGAAFTFMMSKPAAAAPIPVPQPAAAATSVLDVLKEEMFQLETERIQGKLSDQEYEIAKGALDKTLQRSMSRQANQQK
ncbi:MAG TPA: hypothetical protein VKZ53_15455 [Candidatus Angelobacter sp.]|nr:hypothetical protein [Candidatus Angelobacter sp.]